MRILLIILLSGIYLNGQKLEDITVSDLKETHHKIDTNAVAAYKHSSMLVDYNFRGQGVKLEIEYMYRIKIYNSEGEEYSEFSIPLYNYNSDKEKLSKLKATTFNLDNGEITKVKLDKDNVYEEEVSENWKYIKFAMPDVRPGSIVEVNYQIETPFLYTIPKWYFQNWIPTDHSMLVMYVPKLINLTPISTGLFPLDVESKDIYTRDFESTKVTYEGRDIPAIKEDKYVLNENDYRSGIKYEIHSIPYGNAQTTEFSKDWHTIGKNLINHQDVGKQLKTKLPELNNWIVEANSLTDQLQKAKFIYDKVRDNYAWNEKYGIYTSSNLKKFSRETQGNIADINLLLCVLLRQVGLEAYSLITKSRFKGMLNFNYPSVSELNYIFVLLSIDDKVYYLDASSKFLKMGELPTRAINLSGLLLSDDGSEVLTLQNPNEYQAVYLNNIKFDKQEECIVVEQSSKLSNFASTKYRYENNNEDTEDDQDLENSKIDTSDSYENEFREDIYNVSDIENLDDLYSPIKYKAEIKKYSVLKKLGDQIFIGADFGFGIEENPFVASKREYPIFYNHKVNIRKILNFEIPEGYTVESIPEKLVIKSFNNTIQYTYDPKLIGNRININLIFKISNDIVLPEEYTAIVNVYNEIINKQLEQIVLKKNKT